MRRAAAIAAATAAASVAAGYVGAHSPRATAGDAMAGEASRPPAQIRRCSTRIEGKRPSRGRVQPDAVVVGPIEFAGTLRRVASPRALETFRDRDGGYSIKSAVSVRAGRDVTLAIAPDQRDGAELTYVRSDRLRRYLDSDAVRFKACKRDEPAFSYDGPVGGRTWFSGGVHVNAPMCLKLEAWVPGRTEPYRVTVPVGMDDKCATPAAARVRVAESGCDRAVGTFGRRQVSIGTVAAVRAVRGYADPAAVEPFRDADTGDYRFKAPLAVRRGKVVTISIARADRDWASLGIDGQTSFDSVRLTACPGPAPRTVPPYERKWSSWVNGFRVKRLGCLHLVARERDSARVHRATLSFGMRNDCAVPTARNAVR